MIKIRRVYEEPGHNEGACYLVDHLWPRGIKKEALDIQGWLKDVAPSNNLRKWFGHDPAKWHEFQRRYTDELDDKPEAWEPLLRAAESGTITLLYGARDVEHNNAVVLKAYLEKKLKEANKFEEKIAS